MRTIYMHPGQNLPPTVSLPPVATGGRVMNDHLSARLATLNGATRALRELGLRILRQYLNLHIADGPGVLVAEAQIGALKRLLNSGECQGRNFHTEGDITTGFTSFRGVVVSWEEKHHG